MDRQQLINAITTKDVELLKAAVGRNDNRTLMVDTDGRYLDTKEKAKEDDLIGRTVIQFVKRGGE